MTHLGTIAQLYGAMSSQRRHVSTIAKHLLSSNISSTCCHNMTIFSLLAAEIVSLVWGTRANFKGFCVLAALLHGTLAVGVSQTASLNRGRHLYSAGRPSGWALAHILVYCYYAFANCKIQNRFCISRVCCVEVEPSTILMYARLTRLQNAQ